MELFTATALGKMRTMSGIEHGDVRSLDITARILRSKNIHLASQCMRRIQSIAINSEL